MKIRILLIFLIGFYSKSFAQIDKKLLFPIEVKQSFWGTKFIYDRQTLENPLALQIPLLQLRDTEVNVEYLTFKKQRKIVQMVSLISTGFSLYTIFNREKVSNGAYWGTVGGLGFVSFYLNIKSNLHLSKAIKKYNEVVSENKVGLIFDKSFNNQAIFGVGISHSF
ncbi:MAG: hypothetical protein H7339_18240 [Arcicella sp.]|nr:hypothetical protein [Arcicella sp.]